jgi:hypothetical protein
MILRLLSIRSDNLPYHIPEDLPPLPLRTLNSPRPNLLPRDTSSSTEHGSDGLSDNAKIAAIALAVIALFINLVTLLVCIYKRQARKASNITVNPRAPPRERWSIGRGWFGNGTSLDSDRQGLIRNASTPSITISRPISHPDMGPTPIFNTNDRNSQQPTSSEGLPRYSQVSLEDAYDPYSRSRPRSRTPSAYASRSRASSRSRSPGYQSRSRAGSVSSERSRSPSISRSHSRSNSYARNAYSHSRGPSKDISTNTYYATSLPETAEEHEYGTSYQSPPFEYENQEFHDQPIGQTIDIAIGKPIAIPNGPLTPFGEREAKAEAALGLRSQWYKSPPPTEEVEWKV